MEDLKLKYEKVTSERKDVIEKLNDLKNDEKVKAYLELKEQNYDLAKEQEKLYKVIKVNEYSSCNHIWVKILHDYDSWEGRSYNYRGCIKCGLDCRVFYLIENHNNLNWLTIDQKIMYDFIKNNSTPGIDTRLNCDFELAKSIYLKIKEAHPNIDDKTVVAYLEVAINDIRKNKVTSERKENRAKRLELKPSFNRWNASDIEHY